MELEWERERHAVRWAPALLGAVFGAALGADCFLAAEQLLGAPAVLCGALIALGAVRGGALLAGERSRAGALLALPPVILLGCLGHHLSAALAAAPGDPAAVGRAFLSAEILTENAVSYWLRLAGLLGTALAAWTVLFLRSGRDRELEERSARPCRRAFDPPPADMELFLPKSEWIRPFVLQRRITRGLWLGIFFACGWMNGLVGGEPLWKWSMGAMLFGGLFLISLQGPGGRVCASASALYVRRGNRLWRVAMNAVRDPELGAPLSKLAPIWERLSPGRQAAFKAAAAAAVSAPNSAVLLIEDPALERQSVWEWAVSGGGGARTASLLIPKIYPGFSPVPRDAPPLRERPPLRWTNTACTLLVTVSCLTAGFCMGWAELDEADHQSLTPADPPPVQELLPEPAAPGAVTEALAPETPAVYYLNGLTLQTDDAFQALGSEFVDEKGGVSYRLSLLYGVGEEAAEDALEKEAAEDSRCLREDGAFLWSMGDNGVVYRYNLRTAYPAGGEVRHTAVALSERGTLLVIEAVQGRDADEEAARGTLLYMLENLQFTGPAITEGNYQEQLRPAVAMGLNYCGQAFFKAPPGMFDYDAFLTTYLPCGGTVRYYDGGTAMMTTVHGLRVSATVVPSGGTAMDVVTEAYEDLKAAGRQYDEQNLFADAYNEEDNTACRAAVYYDGGRTRATVLVAMEKWEGYYLFKELTCLPEEIDGEYRAVFQEMEAACGIQVSYMEDLGKYSE